MFLYKNVRNQRYELFGSWFAYVNIGFSLQSVESYKALHNDDMILVDGYLCSYSHEFGESLWCFINSPYFDHICLYYMDIMRFHNQQSWWYDGTFIGSRTLLFHFLFRSSFLYMNSDLKRPHPWEKYCKIWTLDYFVVASICNPKGSFHSYLRQW